MSTNLYFVRHAHSIYTPDEFQRPLSDRGFADAQKVTESLRNENIDFVISSPYKRAIQTVEGVAKLIDHDVQIVEDFKERVLSEKPVEDFQLAIRKVWKDSSFSWEGGESNLHAQARGVEAAFHVLEKYNGKNIVIGTHGNIMVLIMNYFDSKFDFEFWKELEMPDIYKMAFEGLVLKKVERIYGI